MAHLQAKKNKKNLGDWSENEDAAEPAETGISCYIMLNIYNSHPQCFLDLITLSSSILSKHSHVYRDQELHLTAGAVLQCCRPLCSSSVLGNTRQGESYLCRYQEQGCFDIPLYRVLREILHCSFDMKHVEAF